jgi:gluconokinase
MVLQDKYVIGLDLGTTSIKAVLFTTGGRVVMTTETVVETLYPDPLFSEQNPEETDAKARKAVRNILQNPEVVDLGVEKNLIGIGISSAMHSLILTDKNYSLLSNMLIWSDKRSRKQADSLLEEGTGFEIYRRTGTPIHPMTPLCKLLWMKETGYEAFRKAAYVMTGKDYLAAKWSGRAVIDYGMASSTGLFDLQSLDWDDEALRLCSVDKEQLAEVVPPTFILPGLKPEVQRDFGLTRDVPIAIGSSDGLLANLGSGAILPGEVNISVGTSGAIRQFAAGFPVNDKMETFTYAFDREMSVIGGATNNGGIVLDFLMELAGFTGTTGEFLEGAENVSPGADGLLFHPYINGERAPIWNAEARGNLFGMRLGHTRAHLARAGLEGIIAIGGNDTLSVASRLADDFGLNIVGIPQTIDNDVPGTDYCVGFDTAVHNAVEAIHNVRATCDSHKEDIVVEVMGRDSGWIAAVAGLTAGAEFVFVPEMNFDANLLVDKLKARHAQGFLSNIIVIAEGVTEFAHAKIESGVDAFGNKMLSGIGFGLRDYLQEKLGKKTRAIVLSYIQRGGRPTSYEVFMDLNFGRTAVNLLVDGKTNLMVAYKQGTLQPVDLKLARGKQPVREDILKMVKELTL